MSITKKVALFLSKGNEMELSDKQIKELKKALEELAKSLQEKLDSFSATSKPVSLDDPIGRLSRIDAIQQQQMALDQKNRLDAQLKQVHSALKRIKDGEYGICVLCEEPLSYKRLELQPETTICVQCKASREK